MPGSPAHQWYQEGYQQEYEIGYQEGVRLARLDIVKRLLKKHNIITVSELIDMSVEEIYDLIRNTPDPDLSQSKLDSVKDA